MTDDLISKQAIMKEFAEFVRRSNNSDFASIPTWNDAVLLVASMPSSVVRCEDCEHWDRDTLNINNYGPNCFCIMVEHRTAPDFFCGDGERKEILK